MMKVKDGNDYYYLVNGLFYDKLESSNRKIDKRIWKLLNREIFLIWYNPEHKIISLEPTTQFDRIPNYVWDYFHSQKCLTWLESKFKEVSHEV